MNDAAPFFAVRGLVKAYPAAGGNIEVLRGAELELRRGESAAVVGVSGVGKSTLLHQLGGLDVPGGGQVLLEGRDLCAMSDEERTRFRARHIGFVFQHHGLLPEFTALENAAMPFLVAGESRQKAFEEAERALEAVGLRERLHHYPSELSGGEAQRAALARALARRPALLLADEPTGNLDEDTAAEIFGLLLRLVRESRMAMLMVTHNLALARRCDRTLRLHAGLLEREAA